ncbi:serine/threonine protein phosphatase 1 [Klebsiella pneumoniae]|nr:serine/threonine protein phosphatase 1 [Klebsiella pneumoniae]
MLELPIITAGEVIICINVLTAADWRNIWLMGDLHGCFALLMNRLRQLRFDPWADLLISVGDLIDRGPQSADCLGLLRCRWFRTVRGES